MNLVFTWDCQVANRVHESSSGLFELSHYPLTHQVEQMKEMLLFIWMILNWYEKTIYTKSL